MSTSISLSCTICRDLLTSETQIASTACGHIFHMPCVMQWFERSKTCPQCRDRAHSVTLKRIYPTFASNEGESNSTLLTVELDNLKFKMRQMERELNMWKENAQTNKEMADSLRKEVRRIETEIGTQKSTILSLKDQIRLYKIKIRECDKVACENEKLKKSVADMDIVKSIVDGQKEKIKNLISNKNNLNELALMASTLEQMLSETKERKDKLQLECKNAQLIISKHKKELKTLQDRLQTTQKAMEDMRRKCDCRRSSSEVSLPTRLFIVDKSELTGSPVSDVKEMVKSTNSPYLAVKSGLLGMNTSLNRLGTSDKLLIEEEIVYDGLGGHKKGDIYPAGGKRPGSKLSSLKYKRLAPGIKKVQRVTEITNYF